MSPNSREDAFFDGTYQMNIKQKNLVVSKQLLVYKIPAFCINLTSLLPLLIDELL